MKTAPGVVAEVKNKTCKCKPGCPMGVACQIASNCLLSITIDCYRFLLIDNRLLIFSVTSISDINRYQLVD